MPSGESLYRFCCARKRAAVCRRGSSIGERTVCMLRRSGCFQRHPSRACSRPGRAAGKHRLRIPPGRLRPCARNVWLVGELSACFNGAVA